MRQEPASERYYIHFDTLVKRKPGNSLIDTFFKTSYRKEVVIIEDKNIRQPIPESPISAKLLEKAFSPTYPYEPLPGVPATRIEMGYEGKNPHLPPDVELFAVKLVHAINWSIAQRSGELKPEESNELMTALKTRKQTEAIITRKINGVYAVAMTFPDMPIVCPPAGATSFGRLLTLMGISEDRIHSIEISGTSGMNTGNAHLETRTLSPAIVDPKREKMLLEDLPDSLVTTYEYLMAILKADPRAYFDQTWADSLKIRLQAAHENHNNGPEVYLEFARICVREGLIPVYVFSKNVQFTRAIHQAIAEQNGSNPNLVTIENLLPDDPESVIDPSQWVIAPTLDDGVFLSTLREKVDPKFRHHALFRYGIKRNGQKKLRLGLVPSLNYLTHDQEENVVKLAARTFERIADWLPR